MATVVGVFNDRTSTESAIADMVESGMDRADIGVIWRDKTVSEPEEVETIRYVDHFEGPSAEAAKGAAGGAVGGAAAGAGTVLLASAGIALIPGVGALLAAGTIAAAVAGAAAGAIGGVVTGGLIGALLGAADHDATKITEKHTVYRDAIERDGFIVTVESDDASLERAKEALEHAGATDVSVLAGTGMPLRTTDV